MSVPGAYRLKRSTRVENDHRHGEGDEAEKLRGREADEQTALLAVGSRRIAQRALEERTEDVAHADGSGANADRRETGTNDLCGSEIHVKLLGLNRLVKVDCVVEVERRQEREHVGLNCADQELERRHADNEQEAE